MGAEVGVGGRYELHCVGGRRKLSTLRYVRRSKFGKSHVDAAKYCLRYLKGTILMGITFRASASPATVQIFSDATWANDSSLNKAALRGNFRRIPATVSSASDFRIRLPGPLVRICIHFLERHPNNIPIIIYPTHC